ncbi:MAG TPA: sigma factor-like helix-turn-helix DNA-binding protein [Solirubrobacteraceae bacterium]|jgi:DNA-directed RNA polymerase specialized sigma24 family protein|nr:sigma factor-like helix-turn-helix DNA-binding protein [Solirubrobacteraceae bacterium]
MTQLAIDTLPEPGITERMLTLTYQVAQRMGRSERASAQLCEKVLNPGSPTSLLLDTEAHGAQSSAADPGRRTRARILTALRAALGSYADRGRLEGVLHAAVLSDEMTLLPPRQRFALSSAINEHRTIAEIAEQTGWTPGQVSKLLRAALITVTMHARSW